MMLALHPDLEKFIGELVVAGAYRSPDEVVTEALFLLWQRDEADSGTVTAQDCRHWQRPLTRRSSESTS